MTINPSLLIGLYRGLLHEDPQQRSEHADSVSDLRRSMDDAELHGIGTLLAALAVWEPDVKAREAQLHALAELHGWYASTRAASNHHGVVLGPRYWRHKDQEVTADA